MAITLHGNNRVVERTSMRSEDVYLIITSGAVVSLGFSGEYEYLLFYSPNDRDCRIAVTAKERSVLVSVWGKDFIIPRSVRIANNKDFRKAKNLLENFLFQRIKENAPPKVGVTQEPYVESSEQQNPIHNNEKLKLKTNIKKDFYIVISVISGDGRVFEKLYSSDPVKVSLYTLRNTKELIRAITENLRKIYVAMEELCSELDLEKIRIQIQAKQKDSHQTTQFSLDIRTLKGLIAAA